MGGIWLWTSFMSPVSAAAEWYNGIGGGAGDDDDPTMARLWEGLLSLHAMICIKLHKIYVCVM